MKSTLKIAFAELKMLFFSPVAWLILVIFSIVLGILLISRLEEMAGPLELGFKDIPEATLKIFLDPQNKRGMFIGVLSPLYLYIPLLTMGLFSKEINSGSIKLLLSSPLDVYKIVHGKFLAMVLFALLLAALCGLSIFAGNLAVQGLDNSRLLAALLAVFLLTCTYASIGLFMSSLTKHQVIAAISTLVVLAALNYLGEIGQQCEWMRNVAFVFSLAGRAETLLTGLINSRDIAYFTLVTLLFLHLTILRFKNEQRSLETWKSTLNISILVGCIFFAGFLSSRTKFITYYDSTFNKSNSLNPSSISILRAFETPVTITSYANLLDINGATGFPENRNKNLKFWEPYRRYLPSLAFNYVTYYDTSRNDYLFNSNKGRPLAEIARRAAVGYEMELRDFLSPKEIRRKIDLGKEENRFVWQIAYGNKKAFVRMFAETPREPSEREIMSAFKTLLVDKPKIAILTGHGERKLGSSSPEGYRLSFVQPEVRRSLINHGFEFIELNVAKLIKIPEGLTCLVIADPKQSFSEIDQNKIRSYLNNGGNLLIAGEPGRTQYLNPIIDGTGIQLMDGKLVQESADNSPNHVLSGIDPSLSRLVQGVNYLVGGKVLFKGCAGLALNRNKEFAILPITTVQKIDSWNKVTPYDPKVGVPAFDLKDGDSRADMVTSAALTRQVNGKTQKIFITGDADFMSNEYTNRAANGLVSTAIFKWFADGKFPMSFVERPKETNIIKIKMKELSYFKIFFLGILPGVLVLSGIILLIVRKRN